LQSVL